MRKIMPEGGIIHTEWCRSRLNEEGLRRAMEDGSVLESRALLCDSNHNLIVELDGIRGVIPRLEAALGIDDGSTREIAIISRVGKPVCFKVTDIIRDADGRPEAVLSRRSAQEEALDAIFEKLRPGDVVPAVVTHLERFGAFVDIGRGIISLIGIENLSVARIAHPSDRLSVGDSIFAVILSMDKKQRRISLSHKELLGTWDENARLYRPGETAVGIVRSAKDYGLFIELEPNLSGLAENKEGLRPGDRVSVYIKAMIPEKMKIKLVAIERLGEAQDPPKPRYFITEGHLDHWRYSPEYCDRPSPPTIFSA